MYITSNGSEQKERNHFTYAVDLHSFWINPANNIESNMKFVLYEHILSDTVISWCYIKLFSSDILMAQCKTVVSPLLTHWKYCSLALNPEFCPVMFKLLHTLLWFHATCQAPMLLSAKSSLSNLCHTSEGNKIYHSDVVGASPVGAAPTTSSFLS